MGKFAKLYEIGDEQLLVMTQQNDDGDPQVACITEIDGIEMKVAPTFEPKGKGNDAFDKAWSAADKYFDSFDQDKAEEIRAGMVKSFEELAR